ncbi:CAP domain-containing protein [Scenedesmus sp. NREL 46B-D3]|nr:CAP domain-containing protein [Scenedesmus sp. NREL 46B-D3]
MQAAAAVAVLALLLSPCCVQARPQAGMAADNINAVASRLASDAGGINTWRQLVKYMNKLRARHGAPPLKWDRRLYGSAADWARKCRFQHSYGGYGENLGWNFANWKQVVDAWYHEEKLYNYSRPAWSPAVGHFTQIVWKESKTVACAYACQVYVCQYQPAGNVIGYFDKNVGRKKW